MVAYSPRFNLEDLAGSGPSRVADLGRIVAADAFRDPCCLPVLSATAAIATIGGLLAAGDLVPGDRILTRDGGYAEVVAVKGSVMTDTICLGAGLLGLTHDITVAAETGILLSDNRFAALFGAREVLVPARLLGRPATAKAGVAVTLQEAHLIIVDGLWLETQGEGGDAVRPMLQGREAAVALRLAGLADDPAQVCAA